jgi:prevent-host-death family protein
MAISPAPVVLIRLPPFNDINIHEAKTHLSRLVEQAAAGREIIIAKVGKPLARFVPLANAARHQADRGQRDSQTIG